MQRVLKSEAFIVCGLLGLLLMGYWAVGGFHRAHAQGNGPNPVTTLPYTGALNTNNSGTIAVTNTFQPVFLALTGNQRRLNCVVQNNSAANSMYVFFGPIANATLANSVKLGVGASVNCTGGGISLQEAVSVTGTSGDAFYAAQQ